jgi:L-arabinose isomerase
METSSGSMRSGTSTDPPRVALVVPYNSFWEAAVPYDLRAEREAMADRAEAGLRSRAEIVVRGTVASVEDGEALFREIAAVGAEAILVLQTLAVQPAYTFAALGPPSGVPVVVWTASRLRRIPADFDHAAITSEGATVGTPMLTNMLVRSGRPFELVVGLVDEDETLDALHRALRAGAAASRLRRSRVGRVGPVFPGYGCVDADDRALRQATGIEPVRIEAAELRELYVAVRPGRVAELERETRATYDVQPDADGDVLARSLRAACALDDLVERHRLDAGALNCHVPELRFGEEVGIAPCFALGRQTSGGIPWTCAGDVVTAVAMLALKRLGGAAQYHELESLDYETGELVVASSGEFDLGFAGERPLLVRNLWYDRDPHCGACACFSGPPGPATLVAFTELDQPSRRYRFVVADGELTASRWPGVGTAHAGFRFSSGPGVQAWKRWCLAGASHHSAATPGRFAEDVETVARFVGVDAVSI